MTSSLTHLVLAVLCVTSLKAVDADVGYHEEFYEKLGELMQIIDPVDKAHAHDTNPPVGTNLECDKIVSPEPPTSVHELRPGDIKVVFAVGDSITAAFGAKSKWILDTNEYRGVSWSIGGDETLSTVTTVPNYIKYFNPDVTGFSTGKGKETSSNARWNQAVSGAIAKDVPGQLTKVVDMMRKDTSINFEEDWKLVTLWIGGNDLCAVCKNDKPESQPDMYRTYIKDSLDYLFKDAIDNGDGTKRGVPRLFVNLVQILDISRLHEVNAGLLCSIVHAAVCPCAGATSNPTQRERVRTAALEYQRLTAQLLEEEDYDARDDFTVVLQPFFVDTQVPRDDNGNVIQSYFAPDCFHFSQNGQEEAATALWNNMLQPVGQKQKAWVLNQKPICPTEGLPYLATKKNLPLFTEENQTPQDQHELSSKQTGIILGTVAVALVAVAIVAVLIARRKKASPQTETTPLVAGQSDTNV